MVDCLAFVLFLFVACFWLSRSPSRDGRVRVDMCHTAGGGGTWRCFVLAFVSVFGLFLAFRLVLGLSFLLSPGLFSDGVAVPEVKTHV